MLTVYSCVPLFSVFHTLAALNLGQLGSEILRQMVQA